MNYSENASSVRFDFFKDSGKWYMTEAISMEGFYKGGSPIDAVVFAWVKRCKNLGREAHDNFSIVVLEPYHELSYPVMLVAGTYRHLIDVALVKLVDREKVSNDG